MPPSPWRLMLALNAPVVLGVFLYKLTREPYVPYIHLLVDYHFGFSKRALIGAAVGLLFSKVPVWLVFVLGGMIFLVTLGLFLQLFRRRFGFDEAHLPLLLFMLGSPFFFKNFMFTLGHFDIYGCTAAIGLSLIPAQSLLYIVVAMITAMVLILIHHIHLLMYVPTIALTVVLRHYLVHGVSRRSAALGAAAGAAVFGLFLAAQFLGTMAVPESEFAYYLHGRMADPGRTNLLSFSYIWYQPLAKEVSDTWQRLPSNLLGVPVFALLLWLHIPLWRYFATLIKALAQEDHRRIVIAGLLLVSAAYLVMFAMVFDYSRWISNWVVCLFLILHAVKALPAATAVAPIAADDRKTTALGWILTLIPRVGIVRPF